MTYQFGEFDSAEELNMAADGLLNEGDIESIKKLATENGIDLDMAELFINGEIPFLADDQTAAEGKLNLEEAELKPQEIMQDWITYIRKRCFEDPETAKAVKKKDKSLKGCIAELLKWSFMNQVEVDKDILKAAGVKAGRVTLGIPGQEHCMKIISEYYRR